MIFKLFSILFFLYLVTSCGSNEKKENLKLDSCGLDISLDSLVVLAKAIDKDVTSICLIDDVDIIRPTTICYINNEIKKIIITRNTHFENYTSKVIPLRVIYIINNIYTLVIHPNFDNPEGVKDKWNWYKIMIKNKKVVKYKTMEYKNYKGVFLKETSRPFLNASHFLPIKIEYLIENYKKQTK